MLSVNIICPGKIKEKFFKDAIAEYSKRLSKYCKLNIIYFNIFHLTQKIVSILDKRRFRLFFEK